LRKRLDGAPINHELKELFRMQNEEFYIQFPIIMRFSLDTMEFSKKALIRLIKFRASHNYNLLTQDVLIHETIMYCEFAIRNLYPHQEVAFYNNYVNRVKTELEKMI
jgi:hypothetical protein